LPDFKLKSLTADKTLFGLRMIGRKAFLCTGAGLLEIDVANQVIKNKYNARWSQTSYEVTDTIYDALEKGQEIWMIAPEGLFCGYQSNNLSDPSRWMTVPFIETSKPRRMVLFNDTIYILAVDGCLYKQAGTQWNRVDEVDARNYTSLTADETYLYLCASDRLVRLNREGKTVHVTLPASDVAYESSKGIFYVAAKQQGIATLREEEGSLKQVGSVALPNGPTQPVAWKSFIHNGKYYATSGSRWGDRNYMAGDVMCYDGTIWSGLSNIDSISFQTGFPFMDILNLAIDPGDDTHFFLTSWGEGLYEFRNGVFYRLYNQFNSPLVTLLPGRFCRVDGARFDEKGNLWVLNSTYGLSKVSDTTLWVLKPDGKWVGFYYANMPSAPTWSDILVTSNGQIWCNSVRAVSYGVFVLDQHGTIWDTSDDKSRFIASFLVQDNKTLNPYTIDCMAEDLDGTVWIGTNLGPVIANHTADIFNSTYQFSRVLIPRNDGSGLGDYLLDGVRVLCIAVDGANRKWVGTADNGVYLLSEDGIQTIHHFTTENSPLPSDYIHSVTVHPETGEVFIGTSAGLVSYRAEATVGTSNYQSVYVFPNPVKPDYTGYITVTGLRENSQIKITDIAGHLIVSGHSTGGQFCWDGLNRQGKRIASGVYLVFYAAEDGSESGTCQFMVIH
jgi:hypothetical protein